MQIKNELTTSNVVVLKMLLRYPQPLQQRYNDMFNNIVFVANENVAAALITLSDDNARMPTYLLIHATFCGTTKQFHVLSIGK